MNKLNLRSYQFITFRLIIFFVLSFMLMRIGWFLFFKNGDLSSNQVFYGFLTGLRFDLASAGYFLVPPYLSLVILGLFKESRRKKIFFWTTYLFCFFGIIINSFDIGFYSFFNDHINLLFFGLFEDDTVAVMKTIWKNYNVPLYLVLVIIGFVFHYYLFKLFFNHNIKFKPLKIVNKILFYILGLVLLFMLGRGNFNTKPLSYEEAQFSDNLFINQIALNGIFAVYRSVKIRLKMNDKDFDRVKALGFKGRETQAFKEVLGFNVNSINEGLEKLKVKSKNDVFINNNPPNIIIVMCESFGAYWLKYQSPDFNILASLEEHIKKDFFSTDFTSAENGTVGSLVSLLVGQPYRPGSVVLSESHYAHKNITSAIHLPYQKKGYRTLFGYGGKLGWRDLGKYVLNLNYKEVFGQQTIINNNTDFKDIGNEWGVFDKYLYQTSWNKINQDTKPFFLTLMTTSNHPPYDLPKDSNLPKLVLTQEMKKRLVKSPEYSLKRFRAFQYANDELGKFISKIKKSKFKDNTIIVFTGDHNFWDIFRFSSEESFIKHTVPLYIHIPEKYKSYFNIQKLHPYGSIQDLMPTINSIALSNTPYYKFGKNLFQTSSIATNSSNMAANPDGLIYGDEKFEWASDLPSTAKPATKDLSRLSEQYRALLVVTELYLQSLENNQ